MALVIQAICSRSLITARQTYEAHTKKNNSELEMIKETTTTMMTTENAIIYNYACYWWDRQSMSMLQIICNYISIYRYTQHMESYDKWKRRTKNFVFFSFSSFHFGFDMWCACETCSSSTMLHKMNKSNDNFPSFILCFVVFFLLLLFHPLRFGSSLVTIDNRMTMPIEINQFAKCLKTYIVVNG